MAVTTRSARSACRSGGAFIFRHVFPGAELAVVSDVQAEMERTGFEILDVQALRRHYALTLRAWYERYARRRADAARVVPERTLRARDLYLAGGARAFEDGAINVHQVLAGKPDANGRTRSPLTREEALPPANGWVLAFDERC